MRGKTNQNLLFYLLIAVVLVVGVGIAYAALSSTLTITMNSVNQNALTWNVGFTAGTVNATVGGTSETGRSCGAATVTTNSVTVANTTLSKPGDSCTYALTINNTGGINAKLTELAPVVPASTSCTSVSASSSAGASMVCGNLTYKITTDAAGNSPLFTDTTIVANNGTQPVYLIVAYTAETLSESNVSQSSGGFTFTYSQE